MVLFLTTSPVEKWFVDDYDGPAFWLSVLALTLTTLNWFFDLWKRKTNFSFEVKRDDPFACVASTELCGQSLYGDRECYTVILPVIIVNKSEVPVALTRIVFLGNDKKEYCVSYRPQVESTLGTEILTKTDPLPIVLAGKDAKFSRLHLWAPKRKEFSFLSAKIFTGKRKFKNKDLVTFVNQLLEKKNKETSK